MASGIGRSLGLVAGAPSPDDAGEPQATLTIDSSPMATRTVVDRLPVRRRWLIMRWRLAHRWGNVHHSRRAAAARRDAAGDADARASTAPAHPALDAGSPDDQQGA